MRNPALFEQRRRDGSSIAGVRGGVTHNHYYNEGLDQGCITIQSGTDKGTHIPFDNLNRQIDEILPPWMKK